jgi:hypothetical protein
LAFFTSHSAHLRAFFQSGESIGTTSFLPSHFSAGTVAGAVDAGAEATVASGLVNLPLISALRSFTIASHLAIYALYSLDFSQVLSQSFSSYLSFGSSPIRRNIAQLGIISFHPKSIECHPNKLESNFSTFPSFLFSFMIFSAVALKSLLFIT